MYDLVIRNGRLVTPDRIYEADIAIQDGKYAAFLAAGTPAEAKNVIVIAVNIAIAAALFVTAYRRRGLT